MAPERSLAGRRATKPTGDVLKVLKAAERIQGEQWLVFEDFPSTAIARALSPNGRAHWASRERAANAVKACVAVYVRQYEPFPVRAPATVLYRWVFPDHRKRDLDNHGTGVIKKIQDTLVQEGVLPDGDHSDVLTSRVEIVVQKGRRALEIRLAPADVPHGRR